MLNANDLGPKSGRKPPPPPPSPQINTSAAATAVMALKPTITAEKTRVALAEQLLLNPKLDVPPPVTLSTNAQGLRRERKPPSPPQLPVDPQKKNSL
jgi:hypothetical protein